MLIRLLISSLSVFCLSSFPKLFLYKGLYLVIYLPFLILVYLFIFYSFLIFSLSVISFLLLSSVFLTFFLYLFLVLFCVVTLVFSCEIMNLSDMRTDLDWCDTVEIRKEAAIVVLRQLKNIICVPGNSFYSWRVLERFVFVFVLPRNKGNSEVTIRLSWHPPKRPAVTPIQTSWYP